MPVVSVKSNANAQQQGPSGATIAGPQAVHFGNPLSWLIALLLFAAGVGLTVYTDNVAVLITAVILAAIVLVSLQIAQEWEKVVVLRFGHFQRVAGPGLFGLIPAVDTIASWIDQRVQTSTFTAEQSLT